MPVKPGEHTLCAEVIIHLLFVGKVEFNFMSYIVCII